MIQSLGGRKAAVIWGYMVGCFVITGMAVWQGTGGMDAAGVAALPVSIATGVASFMWGNAQEWRAKQGK